MQSLVITDKGKELVAKLVEGTTTAKFTKVVSTSKDYSDIDLEKLTTIEDVKQEAELKELNRISSYIIELIFKLYNTDLSENYYVNTLGVYAEDGDGNSILFGVSISDNYPDLLPSDSASAPVSLEYRYLIKVDNAENVTIEINQYDYATNSDFEGHVENKIHSIDGVHGIRYNNNTLSYYDDTVKNWVEIQTGGGGSGEVIDNLESTDTDKALSANQGKILKDELDLHCAKIIDETSIDCGLLNTVTGSNSTASGYKNTASGEKSIACGYVNTATNTQTTAVGVGNNATNLYDVAMGWVNTASGGNSSAIGVNNNVSGTCSSAFGFKNKVEGTSSVTAGYENEVDANGSFSVAVGVENKVTGPQTTLLGRNLQSTVMGSTVVGRYNVNPNGSSSAILSTNDAFVVGVGNATTAKNGLRVDGTGAVYGGTYSSSGADYAEYFEWLDENVNNEDRIGLFVTMEQGKIRLANSDDDYIVGVISGNGSVVGDAHEDEWYGRYERDVFGRIINEWVDIEYTEKELVENEKGELVEVEKLITRKEYHMKLSSENKDEKYIPRSQRPEWSVVGLMGKLIVIDDGTCDVDGFCIVGQCGIATKYDDTSETTVKFKVMERLDNSHIKILKI